MAPKAQLKLSLQILGYLSSFLLCLSSKVVLAENDFVSFKPPKHEEISVNVEISKDPESLSRGLMWRTDLAPLAGMLFILPEEKIQHFWMQHTLIPLDMIFIDQHLRIVGIIKNAKPLSLTARSVAKPSRYVVEVNGGFAQKYHLGINTKVKFSQSIQELLK